MERESIFIIILLFLMISLTIYESFRDDRGKMILGRRLGSHQTMSPGGDDGGDRLDGTFLPPIPEYKNALKMSILRFLQSLQRTVKNSQKQPIANAIKGFGKYYDKAFSRFMFTANSKGALTNRLIPIGDPIDYDDLSYYMRSHGWDGAAPRGISVPQFSKNGARISNVSWKDGVMTNDGTPDLPLEAPQRERLKEIYTGPAELFDAMAYTLLYIYHSLGGLGNNGSVPIGLLDDGEYIELFGSPLNTQSMAGYCSPFKIEVDYFSSLGSFYEYTIRPGKMYTCNPPYIDGMMEEAARRVVGGLRALKDSDEQTDVFFVFPVWDNKGLVLLGEIPSSLTEAYGCLDVLRASGLVRAEKILHKNAHKYYSWYGDRLVSYAHTYIFVLSSKETPKINLDEMIKKWDALVEKKEQTGHFGNRLDP